MMDFLPTTDNFFKYLLTIGLVLIVFTIMYPIQKQKEIDLELLSYTGESEILNLKISNLEREVSDFDSMQKKLQLELDSLKLIKEKSSYDISKEIESRRVSKKNDFDNLRKNLLGRTDTLLINKITLKNTREKIIKLQGYFSFFNTYKILFLIFGFVLTFIGLRYWLASVYIEELKKGKEYDLGYKSSFIRHIDYSKKTFVNKLTVILFIIFFIVAVITISIVV